MELPDIDYDALEFLLGKIDDGKLFEKFAENVLCSIIGTEFIPVGGVHDRGIDALEYTLIDKNDEKTIYQISIDADPRAKIGRTIKSLKKNNVSFARLFYVTNRRIADPDVLIEAIYKKEGVHVIPRDVAWLRGNIASNSGARLVYADLVRKNLHLLPISAPELLVKDFATDPRVFVFLRQQVDDASSDHALKETLADSLILYGLEATDPEQGIVRSKQDILDQIRDVVKFPIGKIEKLVDQRLAILSAKSFRRIQYHAGRKGYCLPFAARFELQQQKLQDAALCEKFKARVLERLTTHLVNQQVQVRRPLEILSLTINEIFKKQGLDFADFMLHQQGVQSIEAFLPEVITKILQQENVAPGTRPKVLTALIATIREIIYHGEQFELEYLQRLSRSYMMLFLVQCEPQVCSFFDSLAAKLSLFVCNSLIIPALSEIGLPKENRRHWNLLVQAKNAGIKLYINEVTLNELVGHIRNARQIYAEEYRSLEKHYLDENVLRYVNSILIRAYLYSKLRSAAQTFDGFLNQFVTGHYKPATMKQEMIVFLDEEFSIKYIDNSNLGVQIDEKRFDTLVQELEKLKRTKQSAENDARTILAIYAIREKRNELGTGGMFSFKTWWLSKDTTTHRAVIAAFKNEALVHCYLRPDFVLNYIALAARSKFASKTFDELFPTLVGISLSHHVSEELSAGVHAAIQHHKTMSSSRVKAVIASMSTKLMTEGNVKRKQITQSLDAALDAA